MEHGQQEHTIRIHKDPDGVIRTIERDVATEVVRTWADLTTARDWNKSRTAELNAGADGVWRVLDEC